MIFFNFKVSYKVICCIMAVLYVYVIILHSFVIFSSATYLLTSFVSLSYLFLPPNRTPFQFYVMCCYLCSSLLYLFLLRASPILRGPRPLSPTLPRGGGHSKEACVDIFVFKFLLFLPGLQGISNFVLLVLKKFKLLCIYMHIHTHTHISFTCTTVLSPHTLTFGFLCFLSPVLTCHIAQENKELLNCNTYMLLKTIINRKMNICKQSPSFVIRKCKLKLLRFHLIPVKMAIMEKSGQRHNSEVRSTCSCRELRFGSQNPNRRQITIYNSSSKGI